MSCNTSSTWCWMSHDHNWANGSLSLPLSLQDCGVWSHVAVSGRSVWQKFLHVGRCPQLALVCFLPLQSTSGQSLAFPNKSKLRNALLHSRSGCMQTETPSSAAFLPGTLNTVYDRVYLYCTQHPLTIVKVILHNDPPLWSPSHKPWRFSKVSAG